MPNYRYRALTQSGEIVSGLISAPTAAEVARRIDYLHLVPIETVAEETSAIAKYFSFQLGHRARADDVTVFTLDLALLIKAGARLNDALELLATDADISRLGPIVAKIRASVLSGETFADALAQYPALFPPMYRALIEIGEASGALDRILEMLAGERVRAAALRRKLADALRYPAFLLLASAFVLAFFLIFVLPQFGSVLKDFGAKIDPFVLTFIRLSDVVNEHRNLIAVILFILLSAGMWMARQPRLRAALLSTLSKFPLVRPIFDFHRTGLFCRNLGILLSAAVPLATTLRILADMMATMGDSAVWVRLVDQVRQGRKLSETLDEASILPPMAIRMLRLGEETGQLPMLAGRVAEFYETKLQRSLDRMVGIAGPLAIVTISLIIGGLIVSIMTALLSVSQLVG